MNCLDYRRQLLTGAPESEAMRVHRMQCAGCTAEYRDHGTFESALREALEVPVPEGFAERMARAQVLRRRRFLAAAAAVVAGAGAGGYAWFARPDPVALACIDFVMKDESKAIMMGGMPREAAAAALEPTLPLSHLEKVGQVMHVGPCPFNGATAYLVILDVPQGKVSLLVMPSSKRKSMGHADKEGMSAAVMPMNGGSVGIVGDDRALVASVAGALLG
ncbi:MAG: DUF3379 family protein [Burkholderiales bacterium]